MAAIWSWPHCVDNLRAEQNGCHFADEMPCSRAFPGMSTLEFFFLNSMEICFLGTNGQSSLGQIMAGYLFSTKPVYKPMMTKFLEDISLSWW